MQSGLASWLGLRRIHCRRNLLFCYLLRYTHSMTDEKVSLLRERVSKETPIFAACAHGNSRSKLIARALTRLGYTKARVVGSHGLHELERTDPSLFHELSQTPIIVCANSDVAAQLRAYKGGALTAGKQLLDLGMTEKAHSIATFGVMTGRSHFQEEQLACQLQELGF